MTYVINPAKVNAELAEALGLDPNRVESITLQFETRHVPLVTVVYYPTESESYKISDVVKRYQLVQAK